MKIVCCLCRVVIKEDTEIDGLTSHGYCKKCFVKNLRSEGFSEERIAELLKEL